MQEAVTLPNNFVTVFHSVTCSDDLGLELPWPKPDGWTSKDSKQPILIWGGGSNFTRDWVSVGPEGVKGVQPEIPNANGGHGGDAINDGEFADQEAEDEDNRELEGRNVDRMRHAVNSPAPGHHITPSTLHPNPLVPILCVGDEFNIVPLLSSASLQRRELGIAGPVMGILLPVTGSYCQVLFGWMEENTDGIHALVWRHWHIYVPYPLD